ncbi:maleate cis-trans isomerase family protein [Actinoallomurus sp. CA-142502]|uniref:maleate cis-trans isomerase family protein n=1 Tax=Actinoallomurus sp. CA-142502 TaxID=3239885 RepID=UPI003D8D8451
MSLLMRPARRNHRHRLARTAAHAGVLVPWANTVVEAELPSFAGEAVAWHYARLVPASQDTALTENFLAGLVEAVPQTVHQLSKLPLEQIYLACTSAAFTRPDRVRDIVIEAEATMPVPIVTAFDAIVVALRRIGASRTVLATPYPDEVTVCEATQFDAEGIGVIALGCLGLADGYADIPDGQVAALVTGLGKKALREADAVVLSCTGWPTSAVARRLRRQIGKPVITSNLAIAQHALCSRDRR